MLEREDFSTIRNVILIAVAVIFLLIGVFGSMYTISEQEQAVVITFGNAEVVTERGLTMNQIIADLVKSSNE